jgi:hypothetical protein
MEKKNLKKALDELVVEYKKKLSAQAKIDKTHATGRFAKSFKSKVTEDGFEVTSNVPYAKDVDKGANPNQTTRTPNIGKILEWAKIKRLRPYKKMPSGGTRFVKVTNESMFRMASSIAKIIKKKGTIKRFNHKGSGIFDIVYKSISKKIGVEIGSAYSKDIQDDLRKMINKFNTNK